VSWSEFQACPLPWLFEAFLSSRSARDLRTERYFSGRLTEVGTGSAKRKGRIERQFSLNPIEGFWGWNVSELFSRFGFFFVGEIRRNS